MNSNLYTFSKQLLNYDEALKSLEKQKLSDGFTAYTEVIYVAEKLGNVLHYTPIAICPPNAVDVFLEELRTQRPDLRFVVDSSSERSENFKKD